MERGPSLLPALRTACGFVRKQPIVLDIALWFVLVPAAIADAVIGSLARGGWQTNLLAAGGGVRNASPAVLMLLLIVGIFTLWGQASILVVARRMLKRTAGRSRTSMRAVAREARSFIIPLLLTDILWTASMVLWGLLLVLPGIAVAIRGVFFSVIIVAEGGSAYRPALRASANVVAGHMLKTGVTLLLGALLCLGVPMLLDAVIAARTASAPELIIISGSVLSHVVAALGQTLFWLTLVASYAQIAKKKTDGQPRTANMTKRKR